MSGRAGDELTEARRTTRRSHPSARLGLIRKLHGLGGLSVTHAGLESHIVMRESLRFGYLSVIFLGKRLALWGLN